MGDLLLNGPASFGKPVSAVLAEPKPSFFPGYSREGRHYNDNQFQLRGFKQYWLKDPAPTTAKKENVASKFAPMSAGVKFSGTIHYRNLHPDELGLLLWCITLDPGCFQNIGKGKPYGYGRVTVQINDLKELNPEELYGAGKLDAEWKSVSSRDARIRELIGEYEQKYLELTGGKNGIRKRKTVADFLTMKKVIQTDSKLFSYMDLDAEEYKNLTVPLPSISDLCDSK